MTREEAIKVLNYFIIPSWEGTKLYTACQMAVKAIADRPHGKWEWVKEDKYRCTNCGEVISVKEVMSVPQYITCPLCDAKIEEGE